VHGIQDTHYGGGPLGLTLGWGWTELACAALHLGLGLVGNEYRKFRGNDIYHVVHFNVMRGQDARSRGNIVSVGWSDLIWNAVRSVRVCRLRFLGDTLESRTVAIGMVSG
jgi:hypothetical protein